MSKIDATTQTLLWAVTNAGGTAVIETGLTVPGNSTGSALPILSSADENTYLGLLNGKTGSYNPLPAAGTWLQAGDIYGYNGGLVIVRQSHIRTIYAPDTTPALFSVYRAGGGVLDWVANEKVSVGMHRIYATIEYVCLQAHTTQVDWTPPVTPALWQVYAAQSPNWAVGVAYKVNDIVIYVPNGFTYKCLQAHTSQADWTPPAVPALWKKQ
jgi:hypothetical protein